MNWVKYFKIRTGSDMPTQLDNTSKRVFQSSEWRIPPEDCEPRQRKGLQKREKKKLFPREVVWLEEEQHLYLGENSQISGSKMLSFPVQSLWTWPPSWTATYVKESSYLQQRSPTVFIHFANPAWWSRCWTRNVRSLTVQLVDHPSEGSRASRRTAIYSKSLTKWCPN